MGVSAEFVGSTAYIGSPALFQNQLKVNLNGPADEIGRLQTEGKTVVVIGDQGQAWGLLAIRDAAAWPWSATA